MFSFLVFAGVLTGVLFFLMITTSVFDTRAPQPTGPYTVDTIGFLSPKNTSMVSYPYVLRVLYPRERTTAAPCILFAPGYSANGSHYTWLLHHLASWGYLVISVDCPYIADSVYLSNGQHITAYMPTENKHSAHIMTAYTLYTKTLSAAFDQIKTWSAEPDHFFAKRVDWQNCIAMGHSLGGATMLRFGESTPLIRSIISLDGWHPAINGAIPPSKPCLYLSATRGGASFQQRLNAVQAQHDHYQLCIIPDACHASFTDALLWNYCKRWWWRHKIDTGYAPGTQIIDAVRTSVQSWIEQKTQKQNQYIRNTHEYFTSKQNAHCRKSY